MVKLGDQVWVLFLGKILIVLCVVIMDGDRDLVVLGEVIILMLIDEIDCLCGQVIVVVQLLLEVVDQFESMLVWMDEVEMVLGWVYWLKVGMQIVLVMVYVLKYEVNVNICEYLVMKMLDLNVIGVVNIMMDREIFFVFYVENCDLGGFILIDKIINYIVVVGMIYFVLCWVQNIYWQVIDIGCDYYVGMKNQKFVVLWLMGLFGLGKFIIGNIVECKLVWMNCYIFLLDGDNVCYGLNKDLGFIEVDRVENICCVGEVVKLMIDVGLIVIIVFILFFWLECDMVCGMMQLGEFVEVFIDMLLEVVEGCDVKGFYVKVCLGQLKNFIGIDLFYEEFVLLELCIDMMQMMVEEVVDLIIVCLIF